jgi:hypothetical protein
VDVVPKTTFAEALKFNASPDRHFGVGCDRFEAVERPRQPGRGFRTASSTPTAAKWNSEQRRALL